jgi:hypothetical protein
LRITEGEMDLRDRTRDTERARPALPRDEFAGRAERLVGEQADLVRRTDDVMEAIRELPNGASEFGRELAQLGEALAAMEDAEELLGRPSTGADSVAAETEAIEALLRARRGGGGGGGGGGSPGGGGGSGVAEASALALAGRSSEVGSAPDARDAKANVSKPSNEVPEELRAGLDRYFAKLAGGR